MNASLVVLERSRLAFGGAIAMTIGGPALLASLALGNPTGIFGVHLFFLGAWLLALVLRYNFRPTQRRARVEATAQGIFVDGKLRVRREAISEGYFQPRYDATYRSSVRFVDKLHNVVFETEVEDEEQALAMLGELGLDPAHHRAAFGGSSPVYATLGRQILWIFGVVIGSMVAASALTQVFGAAATSLSMLFVPLILAGMIPSKIVVGVDGVLVKWLFTKRFIPMSEITAVTRDDDRAIRFHLASGESVVVYTSMRGKYKTARAPQHRDAVLARVAEALAAFRARGASVDVSALVGRGTRTKHEWLDALRKLRAGGGGYRSAVVRDDDLWRVVEDPAAPTDERAGAAMVLRRSLDEAGRARVRVAAEASASPKLRVVLDAAASETDDALETAIDELAKESA